MDTGPEIEFSGQVVEWRGPAPYVFVPLPPDAADLVDEVKADVVYWGVVPVRAWIGGTGFTTAMFPREDTWFLPLKAPYDGLRASRSATSSTYGCGWAASQATAGTVRLRRIVR